MVSHRGSRLVPLTYGLLSGISAVAIVVFLQHWGWYIPAAILAIISWENLRIGLYGSQRLIDEMTDIRRPEVSPESQEEFDQLLGRNKRRAQHEFRHSRVEGESVEEVTDVLPAAGMESRIAEKAQSLGNSLLRELYFHTEASAKRYSIPPEKQTLFLFEYLVAQVYMLGSCSYTKGFSEKTSEKFAELMMKQILKQVETLYSGASHFDARGNLADLYSQRIVEYLSCPWLVEKDAPNMRNCIGWRIANAVGISNEETKYAIAIEVVRFCRMFIQSHKLDEFVKKESRRHS